MKRRTFLQSIGALSVLSSTIKAEKPELKPFISSGNEFYPTYFDELDNWIHGLRRGKLTLITGPLANEFGAAMRHQILMHETSKCVHHVEFNLPPHEMMGKKSLPYSAPGGFWSNDVVVDKNVLFIKGVKYGNESNPWHGGLDDLGHVNKKVLFISGLEFISFENLYYAHIRDMLTADAAKWKYALVIEQKCSPCHWTEEASDSILHVDRQMIPHNGGLSPGFNQICVTKRFGRYSRRIEWNGYFFHPDPIINPIREAKFLYSDTYRDTLGYPKRLSQCGWSSVHYN